MLFKTHKQIVSVRLAVMDDFFLTTCPRLWRTAKIIRFARENKRIYSTFGVYTLIREHTMKRIIKSLLATSCVLLVLNLSACKSKKIVVNPSSQIEQTPIREEPVEVAEEPVIAQEEPHKDPEPVAEKPNFNFTNVLFEFDSSVLKTESYAVLDNIVREMQKDPSVKFIINGHSSVEGTAEYNQSLSEDRANAVKLYIVNAGLPSENLIATGFGASKPVASNDTESGREQNRRVEISVVQ